MKATLTFDVDSALLVDAVHGDLEGSLRDALVDATHTAVRSFMERARRSTDPKERAAYGRDVRLLNGMASSMEIIITNQEAQGCLVGA